MKGQITWSRASRERKEHDYINLSKPGAVVVVVVTFLVIVMVELCGIVVAPVVWGLILGASSSRALRLRIGLNRVAKNYILNIWFWLCDISLESQDMNLVLGNLVSEASISKYAKFEAQWTRLSRFILQSWKLVLKLHVFRAHVWNL